MLPHNPNSNEGYSLSTPEELAFVSTVAKTTGVILDPVYTGKGVKGMVKDMKDRKEGRI